MKIQSINVYSKTAFAKRCCDSGISQINDSYSKSTDKLFRLLEETSGFMPDKATKEYWYNSIPTYTEDALNNPYSKERLVEKIIKTTSEDQKFAKYAPLVMYNLNKRPAVAMMQVDFAKKMLNDCKFYPDWTLVHSLHSIKSNPEVAKIQMDLFDDLGEVKGYNRVGSKIVDVFMNTPEDPAAAEKYRKYVCIFA